MASLFQDLVDSALVDAKECSDRVLELAGEMPAPDLDSIVKREFVTFPTHIESLFKLGDSESLDTESGCDRVSPSH